MAVSLLRQPSKNQKTWLDALITTRTGFEFPKPDSQNRCGGDFFADWRHFSGLGRGHQLKGSGV